MKFRTLWLLVNTEPSRSEISNSLLQNLFDAREQSTESTANDKLANEKIHFAQHILGS